METKLHIYGDVKSTSKYSTYDELRDYNFETGDILLFCNRKSWPIKLVGCCTHSKYSHVAMIIKDPDFTTPPLKGLYVIESGTEDKRQKCGIQIVPLQLVLSMYKGNIYWRKLRLNIPRDTKFERTLAVAHNYVHNLPCDIDPMDWLNAAFGMYKPISKSAKIEMYWTSALIAFMYTMIGLLPKSTPWSHICPVDWGTEHVSSLDFVHCTLDNEIKIL